MFAVVKILDSLYVHPVWFLILFSILLICFLWNALFFSDLYMFFVLFFYIMLARQLVLLLYPWTFHLDDFGFSISVLDPLSW